MRRPGHRPLLLAALLIGQAALPARALEAVPDFGSNPGGLRMWKHVPAGLRAGAPLIVLLHGCNQQPADFDDEIGFYDLAEELGLALLLPEQRLANNPSLCFQWFASGQVTRDQGEVASIRQMVARMLADHPLDPGRVFAVGLSSGGAMAVALLAAYPEVFAGGGSVAGIPYGCARSVLEASACMGGLVDRGPTAWGDEVRSASQHAGPWPLLSIWAGEWDTTVYPQNARETVEQWVDVHGLDPAGFQEESLGRHRRRVWLDGAGRASLELYSLAATGHGMPVGAEPPCGFPGPYRLDAGLCAARRLAAFWGLDEDPGVDGGGEVDGADEGGDADGVVEVDGGEDQDAGGDELLAPAGGGCGCSPAQAPGPWSLLSLLSLLSLRSWCAGGVSGIRTRARSIIAARQTQIP